MAKVLCLITECKYCGQKSRVYQRADGKPFYTCKKDYIVLDEPFDIDGVIQGEAGILPSCRDFRLKDGMNNE